MLDENDVKRLVKLARESMSKDKEPNIEGLPPRFKEKKGVFITLKTYPEGRLRGCIGLPRPRKELYKSVIDAAKSAAYGDPRFPPLKKEEMDSIVIELSILTKPQEISDKETAPERIEIGDDGLIISQGMNSGLLLPQVAVDRNWGSKRFLEETCRKAGLPIDTWKTCDSIKRFQARVFEEKEPGGKVIKKL